MMKEVHEKVGTIRKDEESMGRFKIEPKRNFRRKKIHTLK